MKKTYKGITFAEGYNKSFADFKKDFASTHVFRNLPEDKKEGELREAYKVIKTDGKLPDITEKSAITKSGKDK